MRKPEFIAATCTGTTITSDDAIVLSMFGPKNDTIAYAGMTRENAEYLRDHLNRVLPINPLRALPVYAFAARAEAICDSDAVMRGAYTAVEWDSLGSDGHEWIAAIVREAQAQERDPFLEAIECLRGFFEVMTGDCDVAPCEGSMAPAEQLCGQAQRLLGMLDNPATTK